MCRKKASEEVQYYEENVLLLLMALVSIKIWSLWGRNVGRVAKAAFNASMSTLEEKSFSENYLKFSFLGIYKKIFGILAKEFSAGL